MSEPTKAEFVQIVELTAANAALQAEIVAYRDIWEMGPGGLHARYGALKAEHEALLAKFSGPVAPADTQSVDSGGKFMIMKGPTGLFRFNLHAKNGEIVASSEHYKTHAKTVKGIEAVHTAARGTLVIEDES